MRIFLCDDCIVGEDSKEVFFATDAIRVHLRLFSIIKIFFPHPSFFPLSLGLKSFKVIYLEIWDCLRLSFSALCGADNWCQTPRKPMTPLRTTPPTTARATRPTASVDHDMQFYQPDDFISTTQRLLVPTPFDTTKDASAPSEPTAPSTHGVGMRPSCFCGPKPQSPVYRSI